MNEINLFGKEQISNEFTNNNPRDKISQELINEFIKYDMVSA